MKKLAVIFSLILFGCGKSPNKEISIGTQIWMPQNLDVSVFRNGDRIPEAKTDEEWDLAASNREPAWCYYNNDSTNGKLYGKLYNWYSVIDERGLAPIGWHIANVEDWSNLFAYLKTDSSGIKLKSKSGWDYVNRSKSQGNNNTSIEVNKSEWNDKQLKNPNGNNIYDFSLLPGGERGNKLYSFNSKGMEAVFWGKGNSNQSDLGIYRFKSGSDWVSFENGHISMAGNGFSIRCVKDINDENKSKDLVVSKNREFEGKWVADQSSQVMYDGVRITEIVITKNGENYLFVSNNITNQLNAKTMATIDQSNNISLYGGKWLLALDVSNNDNLLINGDIFHRVK